MRAALIPDDTAEDTTADATDFDGLLSTDDDSVQKALDTLDDVNAEDIPTDADDFDGILSDEANVQAALNTLDDVDSEDIPTDTDDFGDHIPTTADNLKKALKALNDNEYLFHRTIDRVYTTNPARTAGQIAIIRQGGSTSTVYDLDISVRFRDRNRCPNRS